MNTRIGKAAESHDAVERSLQESAAVTQRGGAFAPAKNGGEQGRRNAVADARHPECIQGLQRAFRDREHPAPDENGDQHDQHALELVRLHELFLMADAAIGESGGNEASRPQAWPCARPGSGGFAAISKQPAGNALHARCYTTAMARHGAQPLASAARRKSAALPDGSAPCENCQSTAAAIFIRMQLARRALCAGHQSGACQTIGKLAS